MNDREQDKDKGVEILLFWVLFFFSFQDVYLLVCQVASNRPWVPEPQSEASNRVRMRVEQVRLLGCTI